MSDSAMETGINSGSTYLPTPLWEQVDVVDVAGTLTEVKLTDYGPVGDIFRGDVDQERQRGIWSGGISFARRCADSPDLLPRFRDALRTLNHRYVAVDYAASTRCMDERPTESSFAHGFAFTPNRALGPQAIGATPALATFWRLAKMDDGHDGSEKHGDDLRTVSTMQLDGGLEIGGHTDDKHRAQLEVSLLHSLDLLESMLDEGGNADPEVVEQAQKIATMLNVGCLAVDEMVPILGKSIDVLAHPQMNGLQRLLLGDRFNQGTIDELTGRHLRLLSDAHGYFTQHRRSGLLLFKRRAIEVVEAQSAAHMPIECYVGEHKSVGLVYNMVPHQTLDSTRISHETAHDIQLWGHDGGINRTGPLLFPIPNGASARERARIERQRLTYDSARVGFLIGAQMIATDGSTHLVVRSLAEQN